MRLGRYKPCMINKVKKYFSRVETPNYFGLIHKDFNVEIDLEGIVNKGKNHSPRYGWQDGNLFIKKLGRDELSSFPAMRFSNAVHIHPLRETSLVDIPMPIGILYSGNWKDLMLGESEAYYIAAYIKGEPFNFELQRNMSSEEKKCIIGYISLLLGHLRDKQVYLMEFAPKDIVLKPINDENPNSKRAPFFVDTEHVEINPAKPEKALKRQYNHFITDYSPFLTEGEMEVFKTLMIKDIKQKTI